MVSTSFLRTIPYFQGLEDAQLAEVAALAQERSLAKGQLLLTEGEPAEGLYFVISGRVKVFRVSPEGRQQVLRVMGPSESFNDVPAFDGGPNPANVEAMEPAVVGLLSTRTVLGLVQRYPAVALGMVRIFAARLRMLVALVSDLSLLSVEGRIAKVLLAYADSASPPAVRSDWVGGAHPVLRLTQYDLATMVGTAREVVARALRDLEEAGAIRRDEGRIHVTDRQALANVVNEETK